MTRGARTIVSLTPDELSIAQVRGPKIKRADRVALDPSRWAPSWGSGLQPYDQDLRHLLARLGLSRVKDATVVCSSPGSVCKLDRVDTDPAAWSARVDSELAEHARAPGRVGSRRIESGGAPRVGVAVWDAEESLQTLYAWLRRAGIEPRSIIPRESEIARLGVIASHSAGDETAVLYLDARSSVIAMSAGGGTVLARLTEIGYAPIVELCTRTRADEEQEGVPESVVPDASRIERVFRDGIPVGADARSDRGREILPRLAPVLQRFGVEVKQTIRFAHDLPKNPTRLRICGPGAAMPGIGAALEASVDMHVEVDRAAGSIKPWTPFGAGTTDHSIATVDADRPILLPGIALESIRRRALTRSVAAGAVLAATALGALTLGARHSIANSQARIERQQSAIDAIDAVRLERERAIARAAAIKAAATLLAEHAGDEVDWIGVLANLPAREESSVSILEIGAARDAGGAVLTIVARADAAPGQTPDAALEGYVASLRALDAVAEARVARSVRVELEEGHAALRFELHARIRENTNALGVLAAIEGVTP